MKSFADNYRLFVQTGNMTMSGEERGNMERNPDRLSEGPLPPYFYFQNPAVN
jgi:hypothetical protein